MDTPADIIEQLNGLTPRQAAREMYVPAKLCVVCKQTKAINETEFGVVKQGVRLGDVILDDTCRVCRDRQREMAGFQPEREALSRIFSAIEKGHGVPHATDLLNRFYKHLGGTDGVAYKAADVYDKALAAEDYKVCARIIQMVTMLQVKVSSGQQELAIKTLSKEDLQAYIRGLEDRMIEVTRTNPLALDFSTPEPPPEVQDE